MVTEKVGAWPRFSLSPISLKDQAHVAELMTHVAGCGSVPPAAAKKVFIGKGSQQPKVTLSRIVHAGKKPIHDLPLEGSVDNQIGVTFAGRETAFERDGSLQCTNNGRSDGNDSPACAPRQGNSIDSLGRDFKVFGKGKHRIDVLMPGRTQSGCMSHSGKPDAALLELQQRFPC